MLIEQVNVPEYWVQPLLGAIQIIAGPGAGRLCISTPLVESVEFSRGINQMSG